MSIQITSEAFADGERIPPKYTQDGENVPHQAKMKSPPEAVQGTNSFKKIGYAGPAPPPGHGTHHYRFHLYALDEPFDNKALVAAMSGHVLDEGEVVGTYER
jgi:phosphatidylethanolamine-binding protein (PEBP) family uncharacterized protein